MTFPTYTCFEVQQIIRQLDWEGIGLLCDLLIDERELYPLMDMSRILKSLRFRQCELEWLETYKK